MEDNTKILITGTIYSILLFLIFGTFLNKIITFLLGSLYPKPAAQGLGLDIMPVIPVFAGSVISIMLSLVITFAIIRLVRIVRINEFLKPNRFKVNITVIILFFVLTLLMLQAFAVVNAGWYSILMNVLMFGSSIFYGTALFMAWLFPIIIYYSIVCWIYRRSMEGKGLQGKELHNVQDK